MWAAGAFSSGGKTRLGLKSHGVIPMPNQVPIAGISGISHFAAASENDLLGPMFFRTPLGKTCQHMHWFRDPPCYTGSQFQHPPKMFWFKIENLWNHQRGISGEMIWMDMPLHNAQISFLPLVIPRRQGAGIPLCRHDLQGWIPGICSDVCSEFDTQLTGPWRFLSHLGFERQLR